jgi:hypothetical protein
VTGNLDLFLACAEVVVDAVSSDAVASAWAAPSVLEEQTVGGVAGHLCRVVVLVAGATSRGASTAEGQWSSPANVIVGDYLEGDEPEGPADFGSAGEYFAVLVALADEAMHAGVRQRGADVAAAGHSELVATVRSRLDELAPRLRTADPDRLVAVAFGKTLRFDDYLVTRIVEQVVHLDDLARSVAVEPYPVPLAALDLVVNTGIDVARRQTGDRALLRALYRRGFADLVLPVF